ncbi:MAG: AAA family ATPase, partial [Prevotella sp.]|nr:AAA family ATPase [Prevotella sp.]
MDSIDIQPLWDIYHANLNETDLRFRRSLYDDINWDARLVGIKGARGVGKTTMLLQHIKETFTNVDDALYVSLDNMWFSTHKLEELVPYLYFHGVTNLFFDEVHRFRDWAVYLKN